MTDDETFTDILASFPFTLDQLKDLRHRTAMLTRKTDRSAQPVYADGSMDEKSLRQLRQLNRALFEFELIVDMIERDADPQDEDIPF